MPAPHYTAHALNFLFSAPMIELSALFLAVVWMMRDQKDRVRPALVLALAVNLFYGIMLNVFMGAEGSILPWKYDFILLDLDKALGIQSTTVALHLQGALRIPLVTVYQLMVPMMIGWFLLVGREGPRGSLILAYVAELVTGPVLYAIVPACGPVYALGRNWLHRPAPSPALVRLSGMPNCFPSLHIATALVFVLFARGKWQRSLALLFLFATAMATMATGEHYIIDLVPGLIFGCYAVAVGFRQFKKAVANLSIVLAWSLLVRIEPYFLVSHPYLLRAFVSATLVWAVAEMLGQWRADSAASEPRSVDHYVGSTPQTADVTPV